MKKMNKVIGCALLFTSSIIWAQGNLTTPNVKETPIEVETTTEDGATTESATEGESCVDTTVTETGTADETKMADETKAAVDAEAEKVATDAKTEDTVVAKMEAEGDLTKASEALNKSGMEVILASRSNGATIFAPVDEAVTDVSALTVSLNNYIVFGALTKDQLSKNSELTSLNGKKLSITTDTEGTKVNGVLLTDLEALQCGNIYVYKLSGTFPEKVANK